MTTQIIILILIAALIFASGYLTHKIIAAGRVSDGICIRMPDGEVYMKMSEEAQRKLADPKTERLILTVTSPEWKPLFGSPRKKHTT